MGSYVEAGYFLTGESRPYLVENAIFDRVRPLRSYTGGRPFRSENRGAMEVIGRLSTVDLDSGGIAAGEMTNASVGFNWYLTPAQRVMLNYIYSSVEDGGHANLFLIRYQFNP